MDKALARLQRKLDAMHGDMKDMRNRLERIERGMLMEATQFADQNRTDKRARVVESEAEEVSGTESEIERRERNERVDDSSESEDDLVVIPDRIESNGKQLFVVFTTEDGDTKRMEACEFLAKHRETMNDFAKLPGMSVLREYLSGPDDFDFNGIPVAESTNGRMCKYHGFAHDRDRFNPSSESCRVLLGKRRL